MGSGLFLAFGGKLQYSKLSLYARSESGIQRYFT